MNNKFNRALVLLFIVGTFLVMIGSVSANAVDLNQTLEVSDVMDNNDLSFSEGSNDVALTNVVDEGDDSNLEKGNDSDSQIVSNVENSPLSVDNNQDTFSAPPFEFEQKVLTPTVLLGDEVTFLYTVKYNGNEAIGDELAVNIWYGADELDYITYTPQVKAGVDDSSSFSLTEQWPGHLKINYDPSKIAQTKCFNFTVTFKALKRSSTGNIGTNAILSNGMFTTNTSLAQHLNLTKTNNEKAIRYNKGDIIEFDVCLENNKLLTYFGDYRKIILIQDFYPEGLEYIGYRINPDENGIIQDEKFIHIGLVGPDDPSGAHVEIEYNATGGWAPNSFLNVTLQFRATSYGIKCNHIRTWWEDGTEYWAQASVCVGEPSLKLTKTVKDNDVKLGDDVYYDIVVENNGTIDFYDHYLYNNYLAVDDYYPEGLEYVDYTINPDKDGNDWVQGKFVTVDTNFPDNHLRVVYESGDAWKPGSSINITLHFKATEPGKLVNKANLYWKWRDWDKNNPEDINITVSAPLSVGRPDFTLEKISNYENVEVGDMVVFTIVYTNTGYCNLTGVYIKDNDYTQGLEYSDYSDKSVWTFDGTDTWYYNGILEPGDSVKLELTFKATSVGFKTNTAVAGHNVTNDTLNSTANVTVIGEKTTLDAAEDQDEEEDADIPDEDDTEVPDENQDVPDEQEISKKEEKPAVSEIIDSKATGNPLLVLLLCLITVGTTQLRRKR